MNLLILDDDPLMQDTIDGQLRDQHRLYRATSVADAIALLDKVEIDGAIIDLNLGNGMPTGLDFLARFKKRFPDKPAIIESGETDLSKVFECIRLGANDYVQKPFNRETLELKLAKAFSENRRTRVLTREFEKTRSKHEIIGNNSLLLQAKRDVETAGRMRILFHGEVGVGKTPFAQYSNRLLSKLDGEPRPFEQLNCSCLTPDHFKDELFGHKKGGFTGATSDKRGLVELAHCGDLFLDEIGDMRLDIQANFLTFLDSMEYFRVGDDVKRTAKVRILAATNKDLKQMVEEGTFRKDLYSRISQRIVRIPGLRDRLDDIPLLFEYFVKTFTGVAKPFDPGIVAILQGFRWEEGNVRELHDAIESLCNNGQSFERLEIEHLDTKYRPVAGSNIPPHAVRSLVVTADEDLNAAFASGLDTVMEQREGAILRRALELNVESPDVLATKLGISKATFYRRLHKYGLIETPLSVNRVAGGS